VVVVEKKPTSDSSKTNIRPPQLDLSRQKPIDNTAMVRIRDPVTAKVKTIYLSDAQIEELSLRHENEKSKVNSMQIGGNSNTTTNTTNVPAAPTSPHRAPNLNGLLTKGRQPLKLSSSRDLLAHDAEIQRHETATPERVIFVEHKEVEHHRHEVVTTSNAENRDDDDVDKKMEELLERHKNEKKRIDEFQASPYHGGDNVTTSNDDNNTHSIEVE
jgi:hypothetical protein